MSYSQYNDEYQKYMASLQQPQTNFVNTNPTQQQPPQGYQSQSYNPYEHQQQGNFAPSQYPPMNVWETQPQQQGYRLPSTAPYVPQTQHIPQTYPQTHPYVPVQQIPQTQPYVSNSTNRDGEIARVLQQVEEARLQRERQEREAMELLDRQFAEKLMLQNSTTVTPQPQTYKPQQRSQDELFAYNLQRQEMLEEEQRQRELEERRLATQRDEEIARRLVEEERKAIQIREDAELAKKLIKEEEARERNNTSYYSYHNRPSYTPPNTTLTGKNRRHVVNIHNRHCYCGNTQTYNNNHLKEIHDSNCSCHVQSYLAPNQGRKHTHDSRCCSTNHLHTVRCYCVFRNHVHGYGCCTTRHTHTAFCACTHK